MAANPPSPSISGSATVSSRETPRPRRARRDRPVTHHRGQVSGSPARTPENVRKGGRRIDPAPLQLMIYGGVFLVGYLLALLFSGWERQRFVESWVQQASGRIPAPSGTLRRARPPCPRPGGGRRTARAAQSRTQQAETTLAEIRDQLASAAQRVSDIKAQFGNTPAEDELSAGSCARGSRRNREPGCRRPARDQRAATRSRPLPATSQSAISRGHASPVDRSNGLKAHRMTGDEAMSPRPNNLSR